MLKFGIHSLNQLQDPSATKALWGDPKNVAIDLYDQIEGLPDGEKLSEQILLSFTDRARIYKRTYAGRFERFDEEIINLIGSSLSERFEKIAAVDLGVSDARTSVDFYHRLLRVFSTLQFFALDLDAELTVIQKGRTRLALNQEGRLLQVVWPPFVFNITNRDSYRHYPLNAVVRFIIRRLMVNKLLRAFRQKQITNQRGISLFSPEARELANSDPRFHLRIHNALEPLEGLPQAQIVRAMNLFNYDNFSHSQIAIALRHIYDALAEGGYFITGSDQGPDTRMDAALLRKSKDGFQVEAVWGTGSPVQDLIVQWRSDQRAGEEMIM